MPSKSQPTRLPFSEPRKPRHLRDDSKRTRLASPRPPQLKVRRRALPGINADERKKAIVVARTQKPAEMSMRQWLMRRLGRK